MAPFRLQNRLKWCATDPGKRSLKPPARQRRPGVPPDPQKGRPRPLQEPKMDPKGHPKTPTTHHSATPGLQNGDQGSKNSILDRLNGQRLVGSRARVQKRREPSLSGPHRMLSGPHRMLSGLQDAVWAAQNAAQNAIRATKIVSGPHRMLSGPQACNLGHKECVWTLSSCLWPLAPRRDARSALNFFTKRSISLFNDQFLY